MERDPRRDRTSGRTRRITPGVVTAGLAFSLFVASDVSAGMSSPTLGDLRDLGTTTRLADLTSQRVESISFFLLGFLICAAVVRRVWNGLENDFPALPRLSYPRALGLITLWGLLFVLVLSMISGARELMTPGAWEKAGRTYRLVTTEVEPIEAVIAARYRALSDLGDRLIAFAKAHDHAYPTPGQVGAIDGAAWAVPGYPGSRYVYLGGRLGKDDYESSPKLLAYEPDIVGPDRLVLRSNRSILWLPATEIERVLKVEAP